eukprot:2272379-Amphidinium_carterae.1
MSVQCAGNILRSTVLVVWSRLVAHSSVMCSMLEASIAKLSTDIVTLSESIAELDKAMANATALREDEKKENSETIADAQAAQTAVASAGPRF